MEIFEKCMNGTELLLNIFYYIVFWWNILRQFITIVLVFYVLYGGYKIETKNENRSISCYKVLRVDRIKYLTLLPKTNTKKYWLDRVILKSWDAKVFIGCKDAYVKISLVSYCFYKKLYFGYVSHITK